MRQDLLWLGAVALAVIGTALVFLGVTVAGLFMPGVVLLDIGLVLALVLGVLELLRSRREV